MDRIKLIVAALALVFLAACAGTPTKNATALKAYQTIDAYVLLIENRIDRGLMGKAEALKAIGQAKEARATVAQAEALLAGCKAEPCDSTALLTSVQPLLLEYERTLRAQQGGAK